jgi:hypothetical protein
MPPNVYNIIDWSNKRLDWYDQHASFFTHWASELPSVMSAICVIRETSLEILVSYSSNTLLIGYITCQDS